MGSGSLMLLMWAR